MSDHLATVQEIYEAFGRGDIPAHIPRPADPGHQRGRQPRRGANRAQHLHFHVVNGSSAGTSDGYPYVIDSFALAGTTDVRALLVALTGKPGFPRRDQLHPVGNMGELPLGFTIDDFPVGP